MRPLQAGLGQEGRVGPGAVGGSPRGAGTAWTSWWPLGTQAGPIWEANIKGWVGPGSVRPELTLSSPTSGWWWLLGAGGQRPQGTGGAAAWWRQAAVGISVYTCRAVSTWAPGRAGRWPWALGVLSSR